MNDIKELPKGSSNWDSTVIIPIVVAADPQEKFVGESDPALTYTFSPDPLPSGVSIVGALVRSKAGTPEGEAEDSYAITQGTLALAGSNASKCTLTFIESALTIYEKGTVTVVAKDQSKFKGQPDPELTYTVYPSIAALEGQGLTLQGALSRDPGGEAGDYAINQGTLKLVGTDAGSWVINFTPAILHIAPPGEIRVTATDAEKFYGNVDPTLTYTYSPAPLPDGVSLTGSLTREAGETVGNYTISDYNLTLSGANAGDYHINFVEGTLHIKKKPVTVTADSFTKVHDTPLPTFTYTNNLGLPTEAFTGDLTCPDADMSVLGIYAIKQGTLALSTNSDGTGIYNESYDLSFVQGTLSVTDNIIITITPNPQSKYYGDPDPVLNYSADRSPIGVSIIGDLGRTAGTAVGSYAINQGTLDLTGENASHYTISVVSGVSLTINKKPVTITATNQTKVYTAADPAFTFTNNCNLPAAAFTGEPTPEAAYTTYGKTVKGDGGATCGPTYNILTSAIGLSDSLDANGNRYDESYTISGRNSGILTVTPLPIIVSAYPQSKIKDDPDPTLTFISTPELDPAAAFTGALERAAGEAVNENPGYAISAGNLALTGDYSVNYSFPAGNFVGSKLTIRPPAPITLTNPGGPADSIIRGYLSKMLKNYHLTGTSDGSGPDISSTPKRFLPSPVKPTGETTDLGGVKLWYDSDEKIVYYYYAGKIILTGTCESLFDYCSSFTEIDLSGFVLSNVTSTKKMFFKCWNLETLTFDPDTFDTTGVTDMSFMFAADESNGSPSSPMALTSVDVSKFNTSSVQDMQRMFYVCKNLTTLEVDNWDTSNVTNMSRMFAGYMHNHCMQLQSLDLSGWSFDKVTDVSRMFDRCESLASLTFPDPTSFKVVNNMLYMFSHNYMLTPSNFGSIVSKWDFTGNTGKATLFADASNTDGDANGKNRLFTRGMNKHNNDSNQGGVNSGKFQVRNSEPYTTKDGLELYIGGNSEDIKYQRLTTVETP